MWDRELHIAAALIAGIGIISAGLPALAEGPEQAVATADPEETKAAAARRTFSVTVTNTSNGEVGCHNETTQTSEPGRCEQPPH